LANTQSYRFYQLQVFYCYALTPTVNHARDGNYVNVAVPMHYATNDVANVTSVKTVVIIQFVGVTTREDFNSVTWYKVTKTSINFSHVRIGYQPVFGQFLSTLGNCEWKHRIAYLPAPHISSTTRLFGL